MAEKASERRRASRKAGPGLCRASASNEERPEKGPEEPAGKDPEAEDEMPAWMAHSTRLCHAKAEPRGGAEGAPSGARGGTQRGRDGGERPGRLAKIKIKQKQQKRCQVLERKKQLFQNRITSYRQEGNIITNKC